MVESLIGHVLWQHKTKDSWDRRQAWLKSAALPDNRFPSGPHAAVYFLKNSYLSKYIKGKVFRGSNLGSIWWVSIRVCVCVSIDFVFFF